MSAPRRNHNAFWALHEQGTYAVPDAFPLEQIDPRDAMLFLCLLRQQKAARVNPFSARMGDLLECSGLSRPTLIDARNHLCQLKLVTAEEKRGAKGVWTFEMLNPATGGALLKPERVVWADLSEWAVTEFYKRLRPETRALYDCPACRRTGTLDIDMRPERRGRWNCRKCPKYGSLVNAYKHAYRVDYTTAGVMTRALLQEIIEAEKQPRVAHPAQPLPAQPVQPVTAPLVMDPFRVQP